MYTIVSTNSIQHSWAGSDKKYTAEEKAKEKKYNHEYYMKNKEKWGVGKEDWKEGDSDFDESNYDEKNRIPNSDFYAFKDKDGRWVILDEDMKWKLPAGAELDDEMRKQLSEFEGLSDPNIKNQDDFVEAVNSIINKGKKTSDGTPEFDIDAAAMDVIRGKYKNGQERKEELGEDYEAVQKRVNELMKEMGKTSSTKKKEEEKKWDTSKDLKDRGYSSSTDGYKKKEAKHSYTVVTSDDELYHHGIIGQKWGIRRFQNSDGSLTSEGRQRYGSKSKSTVDNPPAVVKTKSSSNLSSDDLNKILNESGKLTNSTSNVSKSVSKLKKSKDAKKNKQDENKEPEKKLEDMSDKELREFLNRYDMEQRYNKIQKENSQDIMDGKQTAQEILNVTKDVVAIASSAALIYNILKKK